MPHDRQLKLPPFARDHFRFLFIAKHALSDGSPDPEDGTHATYHRELLDTLRGIGLNVKAAEQFRCAADAPRRSRRGLRDLVSESCRFPEQRDARPAPQPVSRHTIPGRYAHRPWRIRRQTSDEANRPGAGRPHAGLAAPAPGWLPCLPSRPTEAPKRSSSSRTPALHPGASR